MKISSINSKRAAMELSVGTIVVFVLSMSVLVLGFFLIQKIFSASSTAIDEVDTAIQSQIQQLFSDDGNVGVAVYPNSREIGITRGDAPKGFAFSVRNNELDTGLFTYTTTATDVSQCRGTITREQANSFLLGGSDTEGFSLGPGVALNFPRMVRFVTSETTPPCPIIYRVDVVKDSQPYDNFDVVVTIE
ncbi:MAG: hypothetical protein Q8P81_01375 [Nanoarchaeota archaeon]|nr:hypothetical protein [Nanoarchaeota archaeon]